MLVKYVIGMLLFCQTYDYLLTKQLRKYYKFFTYLSDNSKPVVTRGRKATDPAKDGRVADKRALNFRYKNALHIIYERRFFCSGCTLKIT